MMDINKRLNEVILKYQLDRGYPRFRKKLLGEEKLSIWASEIEAAQILCVGEDQEDINYFSHLFYICGKTFSYVLFSQIKEEEVGNYDQVVVISKIVGDEKIRWCAQCGKPVTFLYDYLEWQGIYCEDELYKIIEADHSGRLIDDFPGKKGYREAILFEFYVQREKLGMAGDIPYQMLCARKLFFLSLYMRNFVQAEKYQGLLSDMGDLSVVDAWQDIQDLLTEIRDKLHDRKQSDIVMIWMDAVSYGTGDDMPYLQEQIKKGICFENAFTVTPRTNPTAQTMFLEKKLVDDSLYLQKEIREMDSPVFMDLKKHGYTCRIISGYMSIFERKLRSPNYHVLYAPCSEIFWDMLYDLLCSERPAFLLAHALTEGHAPHLTAQMGATDLMIGPDRIHHGHLELDEQMAYYMGFLGKNVTKIFMSDHGQHLIKEQFHTYFVVTGERFRHRMANELFSYVDFSKLLHEILEGDTLERPLFDREYVEVQMIDHYNFKIIQDIIKNKEKGLEYFFGYCGVITKTHLYLKYFIGKEFLVKRDDIDREPHILFKRNDICDASMLPYFRKMIGDKRVDVGQNEKFRYTRYLYRLYENSIQKRKKVSAIVNRAFAMYPDRSVALRMGGDHSERLYGALTVENQKKVGYIIDADPDCRCKRLALPVISVTEMGGKGIQAVVLSSFDHLEELRQEAQIYPKEIAVMDIYHSLEMAGIHCVTSFYADPNYITDEIYDVGFPFDEED